MRFVFKTIYGGLEYVDGLVQDPIALAMEIVQSCAEPSMYTMLFLLVFHDISYGPYT